MSFDRGPLVIRLRTSPKPISFIKVETSAASAFGVIILLANPLSVKALARLLNMEIDEIKNRLDLLHSVLHIPDSVDAPVRLLHLSFRDFLLDSKKKDKTPFWIDEKDMHHKVTVQCLEVMRHRLKKNICNLPFDGTPRTVIDPDSTAVFEISFPTATRRIISNLSLKHTLIHV
jgi:hypothetical protein